MSHFSEKVKSERVKLLTRYMFGRLGFKCVLDFRNFTDSMAFRSSVGILLLERRAAFFHSICTVFKRIIEYVFLPLMFMEKRYIGYDKITIRVEMSSDVSSAERIRFKEDVPQRNRKTFTIAATATMDRSFLEMDSSVSRARPNIG